MRMKSKRSSEEKGRKILKQRREKEGAKETDVEKISINNLAVFHVESVLF